MHAHPRRTFAALTRLALPLASLLLATGALASLLLMTTSASAAQEDPPLVIEGTVRQVISEMPTYGMITSRAIVDVERVVQGTLQENPIAIHYEGGTVGQLTMRVSNQPTLAAGMRLRARLTPREGGGYRVEDLDADLAILEGGVGAAYLPTGQTWPDGAIPVPIRVYTNTDDVPGIGELAAAQNAMNTWTNASCSTFAYTYDDRVCETTSAQPNGVNCISWNPGSHPDDALAVSTWWFHNNTIIETDIVLYDGNVSWSTSPSWDQFDVESVILHELGHSLGLAHNSADPAIVMYPYISPAQIRRSLHSDDRAGVCALYPAPLLPPSAPSGLAAAPAPPTSISLSWQDNSGNEDGFRIERSTNGVSFTPVSDTLANVTAYTNSDLSCGVAYYYRVLAFNAAGTSSASNTADAVPSGDIYEVDDTYSQAQGINILGTAQTRNFHADDNFDWVRLAVLANRPYTITTSNPGPGADTYLTLYGIDGTTPITYNDNCPGLGKTSCINNWSSPVGGVYYIRVHEYSGHGGCTGYGYDLTVLVTGAETAYLPLVMRNY